MNRYIKGIILTTPAGVDTETTNFDPDKALGPIVGISVGEHYDRDVLGSIYLTVEQGTYKPVENVPLTQFLPDGERHYYPLDRVLKVGERVTVKLDSRSASSAAANPIVLVAHSDKDQQ